MFQSGYFPGVFFTQTLNACTVMRKKEKVSLVHSCISKTAGIANKTLTIYEFQCTFFLVNNACHLDRFIYLGVQLGSLN